MKTLPKCPIHPEDCPDQKNWKYRQAHAAKLRSWGESDEKWNDGPWNADDCVEAEQRRVQTEIILGKDWDEERWNSMHPGVPYRGVAADLACATGKKVWGDRYVRDPVTGAEGPILRNRREREEYCKLTGHRMLEPGEKLGDAPNWSQAAARDMAKSFMAFAKKEGVRL